MGKASFPLCPRQDKPSMPTLSKSQQFCALCHSQFREEFVASLGQAPGMNWKGCWPGQLGGLIYCLRDPSLPRASVPGEEVACTMS